MKEIDFLRAFFVVKSLIVLEINVL